jgi:branched-chain amino acid transport system ATP-binding protein
MSALLEIEKLDAFYGETHVLHGVSLSVEERGITALLGANGAGKTTLLRAICNMMVHVSGELRFGGTRINGRATETIARLGVAHVPDGRGTFAHLTVEENLRLGAYTRRDRDGVVQDFARVYGYFPRLQERHKQQAGTLSGGEQQMLAIGRALMARPRLLLLDEPSLGLAPLIVRQIFDAIRRLNQDDGLTVFLVEQNAYHALKLAHRAYVMVNGKITLAGTGSELLERPEIRQAYLEGGRQG